MAVEDENESTHYNVQVYCGNCDFGQNRINKAYEPGVTLIIPRGILFDAYALTAVCEQCGCRGTFRKL